MERINLTAQRRAETGKCPAGRLRKMGNVPAVLYGPGIKTAIPLTLGGKETNKVLHTAAGGNVLVNLTVQGEDKPFMAMFKSVSRHPLEATIEHVDFLEIRMDHEIVADVPVHVVGKSVGVALGGILQLEARKIKVACLPADIPDSLDVDVTALAIGSSLHVKDIVFPDGVKAAGDVALTIVSVVAPTLEAAPKTAEEVQAELAKSFEEKDKEAPEEKEKEKGK
ncbi:MAG: 50S ribosomal protein L25 [Deltaproteobacteria bacterium]|nr:50S ribosomal protein L25 [Deltaproteobacteria bacterium]